jgi:tellurite resistance protein
VAAEPRLDPLLGQLFAQALVAIARADDEIGPEEGVRLQQRLALRVAAPIFLDDLLLAEPIEPHRLADAVTGAAGPFRNAAIHPGELAAMIITDGLAVVLAKGYVSEAEAREIVRFASALGCSLDQIRQLCSREAPWLGALV